MQSDAKRDLAERRLLPALEKLDQVICRGHANLETWNLAAEALLELGEYAHAIDLSGQALAVAPDDGQANFLAASAQYQMGDVSGAVRLFRQAIRSDQSLTAWCNLATVIPGDPNSTQQDIRDVREEFGRRLRQHERSQSAVGPRFNPLRMSRSPSADNPLRIGYISAYFGNAGYMRPVWNLITHHDRRRVAVYLFADVRQAEDLDWFEPGPHDRVHRTTELSNRELAAAVRAATQPWTRHVMSFHSDSSVQN